jgi:hypothetical protein
VLLLLLPLLVLLLLLLLLLSVLLMFDEHLKARHKFPELIRSGLGVRVQELDGFTIPHHRQRQGLLPVLVQQTERGEAMSMQIQVQQAERLGRNKPI